MSEQGTQSRQSGRLALAPIIEVELVVWQTHVHQYSKVSSDCSLDVKLTIGDTSVFQSPNILVDDKWTVKICDFGLAQVKEQAVSPSF